jgi:hypothetical protein
VVIAVTSSPPPPRGIRWPYYPRALQSAGVASGFQKSRRQCLRCSKWTRSAAWCRQSSRNNSRSFAVKSANCALKSSFSIFGRGSAGCGRTSRCGTAIIGFRLWETMHRKQTQTTADGGLSEGQRELARRCATISIECEKMEATPQLALGNVQALGAGSPGRRRLGGALTVRRTTNRLWSQISMSRPFFSCIATTNWN